MLTSSQQALQLIATLLLDRGDSASGWKSRVTPGQETPLSRRRRPRRRSRWTATACVLELLAGPTFDLSDPPHQYPTGAALSLGTRADGALLARAEAATGLDHRGRLRQRVSLRRPADTGDVGPGSPWRVLYLGTFSKSLFPSLRLAYLIAPPALVEAFVTARTVYDGHSAQLMQAVTAEFIHQGTSPRISATCASSTAAGAMCCWRKYAKTRPLRHARSRHRRPAAQRLAAARPGGGAQPTGAAARHPHARAEGAIPDGAGAARRLAAGLFGPDAGRDPQRRRAAGADRRGLARLQ
ncbi:hypothetical protein M8494_03975 [Serratia ureilytica]